MPVVTSDLQGHYDALRNDLLANKRSKQYGNIFQPQPPLYLQTRLASTGREKIQIKIYDFGTIAVTQDFGKTIDWKIKEGRDFSKAFATDSSAMILNEAAVKQIGMKGDIVGKNYTVQR